jgi:hypothetical protein
MPLPNSILHRETDPAARRVCVISFHVRPSSKRTEQQDAYNESPRAFQ